MIAKQSSITSLLMLFVLSATTLYSLLFCMLVYTQIDRTMDLLRGKSLLEQAMQIADYLDRLPPRAQNEDSPASDNALYNRINNSQYVVRDAMTGNVVMHSPNAQISDFPETVPDENQSRPFSFYNTQGVRFYGASIRQLYHDRDYVIQIAQSQKSISSFSNILTQNFFQRVSLFGVPFLVILMLVIAMTIKLIMSPITKAIKTALEISFDRPEIRLNDSIFPQEIKPLAHAVNDALDRLENGIKAQKDFIADAAHELRTPLSILRSHADLLEDKVAASRMRDDVDAMARLVSQLLDTARLESPEQLQMHAIDLAEIVRAVSQAIWPLMVKDNRRFEVTGIEHPAMVSGHFDSVYRALRNLLENALKYSPSGSAIGVHLSGTIIRVQDAGPGIAVSDRENIFEKFSRRDNQQSSGAGLGLFIVRKIMQLHSGTVSVIEAPAGGSIFILTFPPSEKK